MSTDETFTATLLVAVRVKPNQADKCSGCARRLNWFTRHFCKACGLKICGNCSLKHSQLFTNASGIACAKYRRICVPCMEGVRTRRARLKEMENDVFARQSLVGDLENAKREGEEKDDRIKVLERWNEDLKSELEQFIDKVQKDRAQAYQQAKLAEDELRSELKHAMQQLEKLKCESDQADLDKLKLELDASVEVEKIASEERLQQSMEREKTVLHVLETTIHPLATIEKAILAVERQLDRNQGGNVNVSRTEVEARVMEQFMYGELFAVFQAILKVMENHEVDETNVNPSIDAWKATCNMAKLFYRNVKDIALSYNEKASQESGRVAELKEERSTKETLPLLTIDNKKAKDYAKNMWKAITLEGKGLIENLACLHLTPVSASVIRSSLGKTSSELTGMLPEFEKFISKATGNAEIDRTVTVKMAATESQSRSQYFESETQITLKDDLELVRHKIHVLAAFLESDCRGIEGMVKAEMGSVHSEETKQDFLQAFTEMLSMSSDFCDLYRATTLRYMLVLECSDGSFEAAMRDEVVSRLQRPTLLALKFSQASHSTIERF